jgi:hypothetical protein
MMTGRGRLVKSPRRRPPSPEADAARAGAAGDDRAENLLDAADQFGVA